MANTANIYNMNNGNGTEMNEIWLTAVIYSKRLTIYTMYMMLMVMKWLKCNYNDFGRYMVLKNIYISYLRLCQQMVL